jgi:hypothetical protein
LTGDKIDVHVVVHLSFITVNDEKSFVKNSLRFLSALSGSAVKSLSNLLSLNLSSLISSPA